MLTGGDRRSVGRVAAVLAFLREAPHKVAELVECLFDDDPLVAMRAADALEKLTRDRAISLQGYQLPLLDLLAQCRQQEVRWHLAVIVPRLQLTAVECRTVADVLGSYVNDRSSIVKTFAMQGLADLTEQAPSLRAEVVDLIRALTRTGTPAMRARGRKLLDKLERD